MLKSARKLVKQTRKRLSRYQSDRRRSVLMRVGRQLLADQDYDQIAVATIAARARCSVGAFYGRFPDKDKFVNQVIISTLDEVTSTAEDELAPSRWRDEPIERVVRAVVEHAVTTMTGETAGVARAALKKAQVDPSALEPVLSYRSTVTEQAVMLLKERMSTAATDSERRVRTAMQIIHATVLDALLHESRPLRTASQSMSDELSRVMICYLDLGTPRRKQRKNN